MSGDSYVSDCPCCGSQGSMECATDHRPHETVSGICVVCGYQYWTALGFADKETLEELRADQEYTPVPMTDEMIKKIKQFSESYHIKRDANKKAVLIIQVSGLNYAVADAETGEILDRGYPTFKRASTTWKDHEIINKKEPMNI